MATYLVKINRLSVLENRLIVEPVIETRLADYKYFPAINMSLLGKSVEKN